MKKQKKNKSINIKEANLYQKTKTNKNGITLIALVVTIVVLLILAGVTITFVIGEGGILDMAKQAAEKTNQAIANEQGDITNLTDEIDKVLGTYVNRDIYVFLYNDGTLTFGTQNTQTEEKELLKSYGNIKNIIFQDEKDMPWHDELEKITKVDFLDEIHPVNMRHWFANCSKLTEIQHIENLNTSDVTSMASLFYNCSSLKELDVSHFKTDNVVDGFFLFNGCSELENLDVSGFNTSNFRTMEGMFAGCKKLKFLNLKNFNTERVTHMLNMFHSCYELKDIDLSGFSTQELINACGMFYDCRELTSLDLTSFDTSNLTDYYGIFIGCSKLTTINVGEKWKLTDEECNSNAVFSGCGTQSVTMKN